MRLFIHFFLLGIIVSAISFIFISQVFADSSTSAATENRDNIVSHVGSNIEHNSQSREIAVMNSTTSADKKDEHLDQVQEKVCQIKEKVISDRSEHLTQLATSMEDTFATIASRVENFYTTKDVPAGYTIANYPALVSDIQAKQTAVQTALTQASTDISDFSCTASDPKGDLIAYRQDMQTVIVALKDYRTSINELIVAVKSVSGTMNSDQNESSSSAHQKQASISADKKD